MKKKIKKAFTLVELLVVIAILAILATVSIVGYNSFTKKAKVSNDTALVSQLNTLLKADSMVNGDAKTPTDALKITNEAGYDVEKLTPTASDYDIIWNQKTNQFALLDEKGTAVYGEKSTEEYKNWKFVSEYNTATDYSIYLKGTAFTGDLEVKAGIDVGNNTGISSITYTNTTNPQDVRIVTNGNTSLEINGFVDATNSNEGDVIEHYGTAGNVNVVSCAMKSYHVFANVNGTITLQKGHIEIEKSGYVGNINVTATSSNDIAISNTKGGSLGFVKSENTGIINSDNVKVTDKTGVMTDENKDAVAYSESKGFLKTWNATLYDGETTLLKDLTNKSYYINVSSNVRAKFNLNGHSFATANGTNRINGSLTFKDTKNEGKFYSIGGNINGTIIDVIGENSQFIMESGLIEALDSNGNYVDKGLFGIGIWEGATAIINGGQIKVGWYCIAGNGNDFAKTSTIIINGGKLISVSDYALYLPHNGITTINGGVIDGAAGAISLNRGSLTINGGSFSSDGTGDVGTWGDGTGANTNNALINSEAKYGDVAITVNGGNYNVQKLSVFAVGTNHNSSISITSGTYNKYIDKWVVTGYSCVDNGDGTWSVVKDK